MVTRVPVFVADDLGATRGEESQSWVETAGILGNKTGMVLVYHR